jgi:hypothetical protein
MRTLLADRDRYAFIRETTNGSLAATLVSKSSEATTIALGGSDALPPGVYVDTMSGEQFAVSRSRIPSVPMLPMSFRVLVPTTSR